MSHFTTLKTIIRDQVLLGQALRELHYTFREGENLTIRGYAGKTTTAQVVVDTGSAYDIGFQRQQDQSYAVCADWWGVQKDTPIRQDAFLRQVNQTYAHQAVKQEVRERGYLIEEERILDNGEIELVVCEPM